MDYESYCADFEREGARFVARVDEADLEAVVPGCPDWRVSDLLAHVGFVHRWAQYLVAVRASDRISAREMGLSRGPVTPAWLAEGVRDVLVTLRASDPDDAMWAWGADQHVRFWARRMLHETLVHRVDLEQALGVTGEIDSHIAVDAIDEFLANLQRAGDFSPAVKNLVGSCDVISFRTEEGPSWDVLLRPDGFEMVEEGRSADAVVRGPASDLLLTLYRRRKLVDSSCVVQGRNELVAMWWENCALS